MHVAIAKHKWMIMLVGLTLAAGLALKSMGGSPFAALVVAGAMLGAVGLMALDWKNHDEASHAAHKTAWFWGGTVGIALNGIALALLLRWPGADAALPFLRDARPMGYFGAGVLTTILCQLVCYLVAWAAWWAARR